MCHLGIELRGNVLVSTAMGLTGDRAATWKQQGDDLAERQRERTVLRNDLLAPI